jgi:hypothetical protein
VAFSICFPLAYAAAVLVLSFGLTCTWWTFFPAKDLALVLQAISNHVRSLIATHSNRFELERRVHFESVVHREIGLLASKRRFSKGRLPLDRWSNRYARSAAALIQGPRFGNRIRASSTSIYTQTRLKALVEMLSDECGTGVTSSIGGSCLFSFVLNLQDMEFGQAAFKE